jgi:predicted lipoprotein with Yx(FWY)xxD motif
MRHVLTFAAALAAVTIFVSPVASALAVENARAAIPAEREEFAHVPMPPNVRIEYTELDGPVFASPEGKTLYYWPLKTMRNGVTGDAKNQSACTHEKTTHTAGLMSPYPPGLELPELDKRKSCAEVWIPFYAADDAKPVGAFGVVARKDGRKQWTYDEHALYTSYLDKVPGDVMAATTGSMGTDGPAPREISRAPSAVPPGFRVHFSMLGRQLLTDKSLSVYMSERDGPNRSSCDADCAKKWPPMIAAASAQPQGEWSIFERSPGVRQWAFRKKPLYTHALDRRIRSMEGSDVPGWRNVYLQRAPEPPKEFTFQDSMTGIVLGDSEGRTIYYYNCTDDSVDQLACDQVDSPAAYRLAICGGGQVERCLRDWPYVEAGASAKSLSRTWQVLTIDRRTGHAADAGAPGAVRVWAFKGQPLYTNRKDKKPGDLYGHGNGEFIANRNGFCAFIFRNEFIIDRDEYTC